MSSGPEVVVPDVVGEVIGWRAWKVIGEERWPLLASVTHKDAVWHPDRWTVATCNGDLTCKNGGGVPGEDCSCGLYSALTHEQLVGMGYARSSDFERQPVFVGEVGYAGKVIPGAQGWRGEKARIVRLIVPYVCWRYVDPLERMYGVPAVLENTLTPAKEG